jgi:diadenylate cyclase
MIDIILLTIFIYYILKFLKGSKATQIIAGLLVIIFLYLISLVFKLYAFNWLMNFIITYSIFGLIVIFSDEIKGYLASIGANLPFQKKIQTSKKNIDKIMDAVDIMSKEKIGALIVFERNVSLEEFYNKGICLDAKISKKLLVSIFYRNTPLHDGAVIISNDKIKIASVILPLPSDIVEKRKNYGTRHLAAISITKITDALVVVVSEETGIISIAERGNMMRNFTIKSLKDLLLKELKSE